MVASLAPAAPACGAQVTSAKEGRTLQKTMMKQIAAEQIGLQKALDCSDDQSRSEKVVHQSSNETREEVPGGRSEPLAKAAASTGMTATARPTLRVGWQSSSSRIEPCEGGASGRFTHCKWSICSSMPEGGACGFWGR